MDKKVNIVVVGLGYVGLANAILLAQKNRVVGLDVDANKIKQLQNKISPLEDKDIQDYLTNHSLDLDFQLFHENYLADADFIVIATPTNYDSEKNYFDTTSVERIVEIALSKSPNSVIIIKSTIPVGFTKKINEKYSTDRVLFSPEFLREGFALKDNLEPSRIIVSDNHPAADEFISLLKHGAEKSDVTCLKVYVLLLVAPAVGCEPIESCLIVFVKVPIDVPESPSTFNSPVPVPSVSVANLFVKT